MANVFRRPRRGKARIVPKSQWFKGRQQGAFTRNRLAGGVTDEGDEEISKFANALDV